MRVIFLDFDGVLNNQPYLAAEAGKGYDWLDEAGALDPVNVGLLDQLARATGAVVVVSSSWRHGHTLDELRIFLSLRGFTGKVVGRTPDFVPNKDPLSKRHCGERGEEIQAWIDNAKHYDITVDAFVILDDHTDMAHLRDRLVLTSMDRGLAPYHVEKATKMLMEPPSLLVIPTAETVAKFVP